MRDRLDMTMVYAMHDAFRRELQHLARIITDTNVSPASVLRAAPGWPLFKKALHSHHAAEDEALWPVLRRHLTNQPRQVVLLDTLRAEHAALDPIVTMIDETLATPNAEAERIVRLVETLSRGLRRHLSHEETAAVPLIQQFLTPEQWARFGQVHNRRIGPDLSSLLPWLLDGATELTLTMVLASLPHPVRQSYENQWQPVYAALDRWKPALAA